MLLLALAVVVAIAILEFGFDDVIVINVLSCVADKRGLLSLLG